MDLGSGSLVFDESAVEVRVSSFSLVGTLLLLPEEESSNGEDSNDDDGSDDTTGASSGSSFSGGMRSISTAVSGGVVSRMS